MAFVYEFQGLKPVISPTAFIHETATIIGDVKIGNNVYVGPSAVIRGDWGEIVIGDGCNIQECCVVHMFPGITVTLQKGAHIGHGAIIHGAQIGKNSLIGMNAVIMDNVVIGDECIVGALSLVMEGKIIPNRKLLVGNPAKIIKEVSDEMLEWKTKGTALYQSQPELLLNSLKKCIPLQHPEKNRPKITGQYASWKSKS